MANTLSAHPVAMNSSDIPRASVLAFGVFELDCRTGELRESGELVRLPPQPAKILSLLASRPGQIVTREDIRQQVWGNETFVDFERGLNQCVSQIRTALGDDAEAPRYIETLPRRGYRFIYPVTSASDGPESTGATSTLPRVNKAMPPKFFVVGAAAAVLIVTAALVLNVAGLRNRLLGRAKGPPIIHSIAVLPLENLSGDPKQEYFADGMTEELITDLGKISALRVISRTSVMRYKGTQKSLPEIARELNVDAIVEGTVERSGNRVRITANLLYAPADRHLWAESYERNLGDILSLQDDVARAIARQIRINLTPQEHARLASARPVDPQAQEAYLRGRFFFNKATKNNLLKAIEYGKQAVEIDPDYAAAYGLLASCYWESSETYGFGNSPNWKAAEETRAAATKALGIDDTLAEAHVGLGSVLDRTDWDWAGAEQEFKRAIELNPNFGRAHAMYAWHLAMVGRPVESIREAKRAVGLDPLSAHTIKTLTAMCYFGHQFDQAIDQAHNWLGMFPEDFRPHAWLAWAYQAQGKYAEAVAEMHKGMQLGGLNPREIAAFDHAYKTGGIRGVWRWQIMWENERATRKNAGLVDAAGHYALLGEKDKAFESLDRAYQRHIQGLAYVRCTPDLDSLRSDPRFQALLRRMNFPPRDGNSGP